jgi:hypothetical protein
MHTVVCGARTLWLAVIPQLDSVVCTQCNVHTRWCNVPTGWWCTEVCCERWCCKTGARVKAVCHMQHSCARRQVRATGHSDSLSGQQAMFNLTTPSTPRRFCYHPCATHNRSRRVWITPSFLQPLRGVALTKLLVTRCTWPPWPMCRRQPAPRRLHQRPKPQQATHPRTRVRSSKRRLRSRSQPAAQQPRRHHHQQQQQQQQRRQATRTCLK